MQHKQFLCLRHIMTETSCHQLQSWSSTVGSAVCQYVFCAVHDESVALKIRRPNVFAPSSRARHGRVGDHQCGVGAQWGQEGVGYKALYILWKCVVDKGQTGHDPGEEVLCPLGGGSIHQAGAEASGQNLKRAGRISRQLWLLLLIYMPVCFSVVAWEGCETSCNPVTVHAKMVLTH